MVVSQDIEGQEQGIIDLFTETFTASEGAKEGALIGNLAKNLIYHTPETDIHIFTASEAGELLGAIMFSRITYNEEGRTIFVLAPVAVVPTHQGRGIGQKLLRHGLDTLRDGGVDMVLTYGDPTYYSKVGFEPITEEFAQAPFKLKYPHGWLGKSLTNDLMMPLKGPSKCVKALNRPEFW